MADAAASVLSLHTRSMPLLAHLEELRKRIIFSVLGILVGFISCWSLADRIFSLMQQPIIGALRHHGIAGGLVYLNPTEPFNLYLEVALVGGLFVASPFVFYQLWLFIAPGLYRKEKRYVMPFLFSTVALFMAGGLFGYKLVYPASLDFLIGYGQRFQPMITIGEYTKLFVTIIVGLGLIFEMPILVFFLALMRLITAGWMWRNLRYSILVIFIIAAIVTPTADVLNMCLFACPMIALYAISIGVAWMVNSARERAADPI
jgi:sec-independent protein translocase protein TatC